MTFRILPLPLAAFQPLFALDEEGLLAIGARRMTADAPNSAPCRVSLKDALVGERLLLLNHPYLSHPASPYRGNGPIFVNEAAVEADLAAGVVPDMVSSRLLSVRVYDADAMMTDADVVEGRDLNRRLTAWFADPAARDIHIHTARRGCYMARAVRAD